MPPPTRSISPSNRVTKTTDQDNDATTDEITTYTFDSNDRLLVEIKDADVSTGGTAEDTYTAYTYDNTVQTGKTVHEGLDDTGPVTEQTTNEYDERGRMAKTTVDKAGQVTVTEYEYDDSGTRVTQTVTPPGSATPTITKYLYDPQNHTGHAQILEEVVDAVLTKAFTIGHDVISQADQTNGVLHLLYDGHGSTRAVTDALAAVLERYAFDAYGNALGFTTGAALTALLYSGELTDATTGLQYLRARYYDPAIGRFNRLDPFAGLSSVPLSFHRYGYAFSSPIILTDPSGAIPALVTTTVKITVVGLIAGTTSGAVIGHVSGIGALRGTILGGTAGAAIGFAFASGNTTQVLVAGTLQGATNLLSYLAGIFIRDVAGGRNTTISAPEAFDAFFSGFAFGTISAALTSRLKFESAFASIAANAAIAPVTSLITDALDALSRGQSLDGRKALFNAAKAFIGAALINPATIGSIAEISGIQRGTFNASDAGKLTELLSNSNFAAWLASATAALSFETIVEQIENF